MISIYKSDDYDARYHTCSFEDEDLGSHAISRRAPYRICLLHVLVQVQHDGPQGLRHGGLDLVAVRGHNIQTRCHFKQDKTRSQLSQSLSLDGD